jgi:outer membrane protein with beta-barrel domain
MQTKPTTLISMMLFVLLLSSHARAQTETPKFELGVHFSALTLDDDPTNNSFCDACNTFTYTGIGGRFTYNLNDSLALETEVNFFLRENKGMTSRLVGGRPVQGLFGIRAGDRFEKVGVFAKVRPGFLSFSRTISSGLGIPFSLNFSRRTHFNVDVGGVLEFYPSRKVVVRLDVGDTIIRYGEENLEGGLIPIVDAATSHNLQISAGVGFRF